MDCFIEFTILDVRDPEEFIGGHINGAKNIPSTEFIDEGNVNSIAQETLNLNSNEVFVHCAYSKVRGPTCARALADAIDKLRVANNLEQEKLPKM